MKYQFETITGATTKPREMDPSMTGQQLLREAASEDRDIVSSCFSDPAAVDGFIDGTEHIDAANSGFSVKLPDCSLVPLDIDLPVGEQLESLKKDWKTFDDCIRFLINVNMVVG